MSAAVSTADVVTGYHMGFERRGGGAGCVGCVVSGYHTAGGVVGWSARRLALLVGLLGGGQFVEDFQLAIGELRGIEGDGLGIGGFDLGLWLAEGAVEDFLGGDDGDAGVLVGVECDLDEAFGDFGAGILAEADDLAVAACVAGGVSDLALAGRHESSVAVAWDDVGSVGR